MKKSKTTRGFSVREFEDFNGVKCRIQKSSLATEDCIWLGADKLVLQKFTPFGKPNSWQIVDVDELLGTREWVANERMHLNKRQVKALIKALQKFVDTGDL